MKRLFASFLLVGAMPLLATLEEAPACPTQDTLAAFLTTYNGCNYGIWTFQEFSWTQSGDVQVDPADVWIRPTGTEASPGIEFWSDKFVAGTGQRLRSTLDYKIDPPPVIIDGFSLALNTRSPQNGGTALVTAEVCPGGDLQANCRSKFLEVYYYSIPLKILQFDFEPIYPYVNLLDVRITIDLQGNEGTSQITGATAAASTTLDNEAIPEPGTLGMMAGALLLAAAGRKLRKVRLQLPPKI